MTAFINTPPRYSFSKMDFFTRFKLSTMMYKELPITQIAKKLGIHRSTIYRELKKYTKPDGDYFESL